jgi:hypothetical protein
MHTLISNGNVVLLCSGVYCVLDVGRASTGSGRSIFFQVV